jgi:hypothetical protein
MTMIVLCSRSGPPVCLRSRIHIAVTFAAAKFGVSEKTLDQPNSRIDTHFNDIVIGRRQESDP